MGLIQSGKGLKKPHRGKRNSASSLPLDSAAAALVWVSILMASSADFRIASFYNLWICSLNQSLSLPPSLPLYTFTHAHACVRALPHLTLLVLFLWITPTSTVTDWMWREGDGRSRGWCFWRLIGWWWHQSMGAEIKNMRAILASSYPLNSVTKFCDLFSLLILNPFTPISLATTFIKAFSRLFYDDLHNWFSFSLTCPSIVHSLHTRQFAYLIKSDRNTSFLRLLRTIQWPVIFIFIFGLLFLNSSSLL